MIWGIIAAIFAVIAAIAKAGYNGRQNERLKQKVADHENADNIRDRVSDADGSMSEHDDDGWRD